MIKAVVFDLDDTVYDYQLCDQYAMDRLRRYCMDVFLIQEEDFNQTYGKAKKIVKERLGNVGASHNRMLYMQTFLELIAQKPSVHALELYNMYWDSMLETMQLYSFVLPLFQKLSQQGIRIAVLTDLTANIQHRKIKKLGIAEYVDVLVTSEEAGEEKPDGKMFGLIIEKLNLLPYQILMVGDSYKKDIEGAKAVGMHGILYRSGKENTIIQECMELIANEAERK